MNASTDRQVRVSAGDGAAGIDCGAQANVGEGSRDPPPAISATTSALGETTTSSNRNDVAMPTTAASHARSVDGPRTMARSRSRRPRTCRSRSSPSTIAVRQPAAEGRGIGHFFDLDARIEAAAAPRAGSNARPSRPARFLSEPVPAGRQQVRTRPFRGPHTRPEPCDCARNRSTRPTHQRRKRCACDKDPVLDIGCDAGNDGTRSRS